MEERVNILELTEEQLKEIGENQKDTHDPSEMHVTWNRKTKEGTPPEVGERIVYWGNRLRKLMNERSEKTDLE